MEGDPDGTISLAGFLESLGKIRAALFYTARLGASPEASRSLQLQYRIVHLAHKSPFKVVLEASVLNGHDDPTSVGPEMVRNLSRLQNVSLKRPPPVTDMDALQAYRRIGDPVERYGTGKLMIQSGRSRVSITRDYVQNLDRVIGPDTKEGGSVTGWLLKVNLHDTSRFDVYPVIGPRKVTCRFGRSLREKVVRSVDKYVTVHGELRFKQWDRFPYAITAEDIEAHPPASDLPRLTDIRGMAPNATGSVRSEDFIESIREKAW
jgi:hypothetical protein